MTKTQRKQVIHATLALLLCIALSYWYVATHDDAFSDPISNAYRNSNVSGLPALETVDHATGTPMRDVQVQPAGGLYE